MRNYVFSGGKRVVNEFFEFFSVVSLKTEVCHMKITSRKVIGLFFAIERGRQCGLRESSFIEFLISNNAILAF